MLTKTKIINMVLAISVVAVSRFNLASWMELGLVLGAVLLADALNQPKLKLAQRFLNLGFVTNLSLGLLVIIAPKPLASGVMGALMAAWLLSQQRLNIEVKAILSQF